jgi:predicted small integral membrane protein
VRGARIIAGLHGAYLVTTGLWPILHRRSFERVTGRKHEFWLVRVVGALAAVSGLTLGVAALRGRRSVEAQTLAAGSAIVFGIADLYAGSRVSPVYFADLVPQALVTPAWFASWESWNGMPSDQRLSEPRSEGNSRLPILRSVSRAMPS